MVLKEPAPFDSSRRRYLPVRPFPPYRFIPGLTPHPTGAGPKVSFLPPERWRENEEYLYAVDLYNFNYWWEAHEGWEAIWKTTPRTDDTGQFLQGLIQISAAMIKWWIGNQKGMEKLSRDGLARLRSVREKSFMGIELPAHVGRIERFLRGPTAESYPFIELRESP